LELLLHNVVLIQLYTK